MGNPELSQFVGFGEFELDLRTRELWIDGRKSDLQEQSFQVLSMLLERPGELVTREQLTKRLWPCDTFVDFEHGLNQVIKRLRDTLGDSAVKPRFIQTLSRRGYRFVAPVRQLNRPIQGPPIADFDAAVVPPLDDSRRPEGTWIRSWRQRMTFVLLVFGLGCGAGLLTFWLLSPGPTLKVIAMRQLTTFGGIDAFGRLVTDGYRIYFLQREGDRWNLSQTSVSGGEQQSVPAPFRNTVILDISPDRANFLIASFVRRYDVMPLWIWPVQGGAPKRFGDVIAYDGKWCPNGRQILYSKDDGIYQADVDGTNAHKFVATPDGHADRFSWSPDGQFLRFTVFTAKAPGSSIWQVNSDGTHLHRFEPGWEDGPQECCGSWSPDGEYFFFTSTYTRTQDDIWAIREKPTLFHRHAAEPVRLTSGPVGLGYPLPSPDGRKLFVLGGGGRGELVRYDLKSHQFIPWLSPVSAFTLAVSHDGTWLVYESSPDRNLIRVRADGSQPLVLTPAGLKVTGPSWSPDGKQIAFAGEAPEGHRIFLVSPDGGIPKELLPDHCRQEEPAWSPDGRHIAFDRFSDSTDTKDESVSIQVFNVVTNQVSLLQGSEGLRSPSWSPDGRFVAATSEDGQKLKLLDLLSQKWTELDSATLINGIALMWSNDGRFLYYQDLLAPYQPIYRMRLRDRKRELVTTFETYLHSGIQRASLAGLASDRSLIARLDRGGAYIYSLDLETH